MVAASRQRLVLLTSGDGDAATASLRSSLAAWCRAGLLGNVAWAKARELSEQARLSPCEFAQGLQWVEAPLAQAALKGVSELWVCALRGPGDRNEDTLAAEEAALATLQRLFGKGVALRSITVTVAGRYQHFDHSDFSAMWDLHLIHDRRVAADHRSTVHEADETAPLELGAGVALCAAGGWLGSAQTLDLTDPVAGPIKNPRIVHSEIRVLHAPDIAFLGLPESPPWPIPSAAGVRPAVAGSMPPRVVSRQVVAQCRFECADYRDPDGGGSVGLFGSLFRTLQEPSERHEAELALKRLAERTGGYEPGGTGPMVRLALRGTDHVDALVSHIKQSSFPIGIHSAGAEASTPQTWETVRGTMFGLVDGSDLPRGVSEVTSGQGRDGERLVWCDPSALAPARVPSASGRESVATPQPTAAEAPAPHKSEGFRLPIRIEEDDGDQRHTAPALPQAEASDIDEPDTPPRPTQIEADDTGQPQPPEPQTRQGSDDGPARSAENEQRTDELLGFDDGGGAAADEDRGRVARHAARVHLVACHDGERLRYLDDRRVGLGARHAAIGDVTVVRTEGGIRRAFHHYRPEAQRTAVIALRRPLQRYRFGAGEPEGNAGARKQAPQRLARRQDAGNARRWDALKLAGRIGEGEAGLLGKPVEGRGKRLRGDGKRLCCLRLRNPNRQ